MCGVATTRSNPASRSPRSIASDSSVVLAPSSMAAIQWQCRSMNPRTSPGVARVIGVGVPAMPDHDRPLDLVLWGATGFTGALVAEYLRRQYGAPRGVALGDRRSQPGQAGEGPRAPRGDRRVGGRPAHRARRRERPRFARRGRASDAASCARPPAPSRRYGRELVAACVEAGTDYCDSTGEPQFVRAMIDAHHARARETGARIVSLLRVRLDPVRPRHAAGAGGGARPRTDHAASR